MKIQKVWAIAFSPNGTTERAVKLLAEELAAKLDAKRKADAAKVLDKDRTIAANL